MENKTIWKGRDAKGEFVAGGRFLWRSLERLWIAVEIGDGRL